jgi:Ser/Thr protein kinase RdoA (MazF antagonist)
MTASELEAGMSERTIARLEAAYSTASAESVAKVVTEGYALAPLIECSLLHRGFNDSFEIKTANNQRYMLRISCRRPRGEADVASETAFLAYLDSVGAPVATPAPTRNGALFMLGHLPEGWRPIVLFHYAEGRDPKADSPDDARAQGITLARIHAAADR